MPLLKFPCPHIAGAQSVPLDEIVRGVAYLPDPEMEPTLILVCSDGPKSLVALDFLYDRFERIFCIEGGVAEWERQTLPVEACESEGSSKSNLSND